MGIYLVKLKVLIAATWLLAGSALGNGAENATAAITRAAKGTLSRNVHIEAPASLAPAPVRVVLTKRPEELNVTSPTSTSIKAIQKPSRNPFQRSPKSEVLISPAPSVKPSPNPKPSPTQKPKPTLPILSPTLSEKQNRGSSTSLPSPPGSGEIGTTPLPSVQPSSTTPIPTLSPDISVGALLVSGNPPRVKAGELIKFSVFVRDSADAAVKNKTLTFVLNGKAVSATTDENGNALLEIPAPTDFVGNFNVRIGLYGKEAVFTVDVVSTKPELSLSSFAFTVAEFQVRLRNAAGESVPNWQVTETGRDGSVIATKITNELGVIEFDLPAREAGGHLYACAEVKDIGKQCEEW